MKNTLAENMLRFGVKNLKETEIEKLKEQANIEQSNTYNDAGLFDDMFKRGEIKIGTTKPKSGFHIVESKSHAVMFRNPVVFWDGQYGLVYAKKWRTLYSDSIPDVNTPEFEKWQADNEAKINASPEVITPIAMLGDRVVPANVLGSRNIEKPTPFGYAILKFAAKYMSPEAILGGSSFLALSPGIKNNLATYTPSRLTQDISAGVFGDPNKVASKKDSLIKGFNLKAI